MINSTEIIKNTSFKDTEYEYYDHPILTSGDEEDLSLLDTAYTNLQIFHDQSNYKGVNWSDGTPMMEYPKFHRGEKYKLPVNEYSIKKYSGVKVKIHFGTIENVRSGEGRKIEVIGEAKEDFHFEKVYPLLNFEGRSWQHFLQDCSPILMYGMDLLKANPDIDLLIYEPQSWNLQTFLELMKYFNLDNKVVFVPYGQEIILNVKTLYNFEAFPTVPVCWWNNWFYKEVHDRLSLSNENKNVIFVNRKNSRKITNAVEISNILERYSLDNNLDFYIIDPSEHTAQYLFELFSKSHTVLSPNGGASFHMFFCNKNTKFIEVGFVDWIYILYNIASAIKFKYYVMPVRGHNNTTEYYLSPEKLIKILNK